MSEGDGQTDGRSSSASSKRMEPETGYWANATPSGPMPWWAFAAFYLVFIAGLSGVFAVTGSPDAQLVFMFAYLFGVGRPLRRLVPRTREYKVDSGERWSTPILIVVVVCASALVVVAMIGLSRGLDSVGLYPGQWAIFTAVFLMPLGFLGNKYGRLPRENPTGGHEEKANPGWFDADRPGWLAVRSPESEAVGSAERADSNEDVLRVLGVDPTTVPTATESPTWLPIRYSKFWDVPRLFALESDGGALLFESEYDEKTEGYSATYSVYRLDELPASEALNTAKRGARVGEVAVKAVRFDITRKQAVHRSVLLAIGG